MSPFHLRGAIGASSFVAVVIASLSGCNEFPTTSRVSINASSAAKPSSSAYKATFDDAALNKLRSDGAAYPDGDTCVTSDGGSAGGGLYQLRTIANTVVCKTETRGSWRFITIDVGIGFPAADLDQDGIVETSEAAPARFQALKVFANSATSTPVRIFVLEVLPDGSTTQNTKWTISYKNEASVKVTSGVRVVQAFPGTAAADIYTGDSGVFVKTVDLPFKLTLSPDSSPLTGSGGRSDTPPRER